MLLESFVLLAFLLVSAVWLRQLLNWPKLLSHAISTMRNGSRPEQAEAALAITLVSLFCGPWWLGQVTQWTAPIMKQTIGHAGYIAILRGPWASLRA